MRDYNNNSNNNGGRFHNNHRRHYHNNSNRYRQTRPYNSGGEHTGNRTIDVHRDSNTTAAALNDTILSAYAESLLGTILPIVVAIDASTTEEVPFVRAYSRECMRYVTKCRERFARSIRVRIRDGQYEKISSCSADDWAHFATNVSQVIVKADLTLVRGADETVLITYVRGNMLYATETPNVFSNNIYILDARFLSAAATV